MSTLSTIYYKSPLHQMTQTTPTCLWNDSASISELSYSIEHGAVGATCNPVIAVSILNKEISAWKARITELADILARATEGEIGWRIVEEMSTKAAALLEPIFREQRGKNGRLSIQTDPRLFRDAGSIIDQALRFHDLAPNIIVKIPATHTGIDAIEEATYRGITVNATVCFTLPQCVAVAEAVERGLKRREKEGKDISMIAPVCTIMVGRLDDWLKVCLNKQSLCVDPGFLEWAGVTVFKKTYQLFRKRGYRLRLLSAAFRNHMHWSEFIGGDVIISPPYAWQVRYNASDIEVIPRIDNPVDKRIVSTLIDKFADFRKAYGEDELTPAEFDTFGPTRRTLRQFIGACHELEILVRDILIPNPDL